MQLAHCKWDVQVGDGSSLAPFPLLLDIGSWRELAELAERLCAETEAMETALLERTDLHSMLGLPRALRAIFAQRKTATPAAVRVMRFDFHWTTDGWRISEVNSDVPGGYTEATSFTRLVGAHFDAHPTGDPTAAVVEALRRHGHGTVALTSAPGHMEDHQVVAYLAAQLRNAGVLAEVVAPAHLRWHRGKATIENAWVSGPASAVFRFYQAEWLARLPRRIAWQPLFVGARTPVANPGTAALAESKRLPLVWDQLGIDIPTWRRLLPETRALANAPWIRDDRWLIKAAYSNTGDTVLLRESMTTKDWLYRVGSAQVNARHWIAQRRFDVVPLIHDGERLFPCIGVYTVDGVAAGTYARISRRRVIDAYAQDVAVLVESEPS